MSVVTQGWGDPFAPLAGGYGASAPAWLATADPSRLDVPWWWQRVSAWPLWPAVVAPAPATWWSWWWAAPMAVPAQQYASGRGLAHGHYQYRSAGAGDGDEDMAAIALPPTPHTVLLRSHDKFVPFTIDFARDVAPSDAVSAYWITVWAQPLEQEGVTATEVTASLLMGQSSSGTKVTAVLCNANAVPDTQYTVRVVASMASGLTLEQAIGDGPESRVLCDR